MGKILVSGLVNLEMSVPVNSFPVDYSPITYLFNGISTAVSGVGYNVFCALESLGDSVRPCSVTGRDLAALVIARAFMEKKAETDFLFPVLDKTCTSCVLFDDQGRRRIFCDLTGVQKVTLPEKAFGSLVSGIEGVVLCNTNFNRGLLDYLCKKDLPVFTDVHVLSDVHDSYNSPFMKRADVLFLSHENVPGNHEEFLIRLYNEYRNKIIVLGQGSLGAMLLDGEKREIYTMESVLPRPLVNTLGAGDALFSSFVYFYLKKFSPLDALKYAVTFAGWKIGESGGSKGFCTGEELFRLVKELEKAGAYRVHFIKAF